MKDSKECNKFQGLRWCAISSKRTVISVKSTPDEAYFDAVSQGECSPIIVRGYIVENEKNDRKRGVTTI